MRAWCILLVPFKAACWREAGNEECDKEGEEEEEDAEEEEDMEEADEEEDDAVVVVVVVASSVPARYVRATDLSSSRNYDRKKRDKSAGAI